MQRIVVKIGSRVLAKKNGLLNEKIVSDFICDLAKLKKEKNVDLVIVTSGAVSVGKAVKGLLNFRIEAEAITYDKNIILEQVMAAVGQPKLMAFYINEFQRYNLHCAQILATRADNLSTAA